MKTVELVFGILFLLIVVGLALSFGRRIVKSALNTLRHGIRRDRGNAAEQ